MTTKKILITLALALAVFFIQHNALYSVSVIGMSTNYIVQMTGNQMHHIDVAMLMRSENSLIVSCGFIALIAARRKSRDRDNT